MIGLNPEALPPPLGSDGQCTGFPNGIGDLNWRACCIAHDLGGSDVDLTSCIAGQVPWWAYGIVVACVVLMRVGRPIYNEMQRKGWVK